MTEQDDMAVRAVIEKTRRALRVPPSVPDSALPVFAEQVAGQRDLFRDQRNSLDEKRHELLAELDALSDLVAEADGEAAPDTFDELRRRVRSLADDARRWRKLGAAGQATPEMLARALHEVEVQEAAKVEGSRISVLTADGVDRPEDRQRLMDELMPWDPASDPYQADLVDKVRRAMEGLRVVPSVSLLPVSAAELGRAMYESGPHRTPWDEVAESYTAHAQRVLDRLPSYVAPKAAPADKTGLTSLHPAVLAELLVSAMVDQRVADGGKVGDALPVFSWEDMLGIAQSFWVGVAERVRHAVEAYRPEVAPADQREVLAETLFTASQDTSARLGSAPVRMVDTHIWSERQRDRWMALARTLRKNLLVVPTELEPRSPEALKALRVIAADLGMSFGGSEDESAIGMLTVEAFRQHKQAVTAEIRDLAAQVREASSAPGNALGFPVEFDGQVPPGTFVMSSDGKAMIGRSFLMSGALKGRPLARVDADKAALLEQVRALGSELERSQALVVSRDDRMQRLRELTGLEGGGVSEDDVVDAIAATFGDFNARLPKLAKDNRRLRQRNKELRVELSAALGIEGMSNVELVRRGRELFNVEQEFEQFRRDLARTMVSKSVRPEALLWTAQQLVSFERRHAVCKGAAALESEMVEQLAEAAGLSPESGWTWRPLLERVRADLDSGRRAAQVVADRHEDLSRATGRADASWEELIELVTGLAAQADREAWPDVNALAEIREVLGLHPKLFRAGVVDQVKDLRDTRARMEGQLWRVLAELGLTGMHVNAATERALEVIKELRTKQVERTELARRMGGVTLTLAEAAGIGIGDSVEVMVQKAGDAAAILRSWPDVNALAEIREVLGLHPKMYPAGVVSAVEDLKSSRGVAEGQLLRLFQACGVQHETWAASDVQAATDRALAVIGELRLDVFGLPVSTEERDRERRSMIELRDMLGLSEGADVTHVVRQVRELKTAAFDREDHRDAKRVRDAVFTLLEAARIDTDGDSPDVAVQKAGDAAAILRSWPDVLRGVAAFDGDEVEQPDEVEPTLQALAKGFLERDRLVGVVDSLERLLAAHRCEPLKADVETLYERVDNLVANLFEPLREIGGRFEVPWTPGDPKMRFAELVLIAFREHEDALRDGLAAFDIGTPTLAEIPGVVKGYAKTYHSAGRYQAVLHGIEVALSAWTGEPKRFDDATLKQRLADLVRGLNTGRVPMWASFTEQIAARFESMVRLRPDADDPDFLVMAELEPLHKATLLHAATQVRAHGAALVSGQEKHPLVMALESKTFWAPGVRFSKDMSGDLELVPYAGGGVTLRLDGGDEHARFILGPLELAPVGAALLALSYHHVREQGRKRELEQAENLAEANADAESES